MAACTNHGGKARRVVTAALVGVLSVGTVPMVALATGANDGIQQLAADWHTDAKVTAAEDGKGAVFAGDLTKPVSFGLSSGKYLVPTEVTGQAGATEIDPNEYDLYYQAKTASTDWTGLNPTAGVYQYVDGKGQTITADYKTDKWLDAAAAYFSGELTDTANAPIKVAADTYTVKIVEKGADPQVAPGVSMSFTLVDEDPYASAYVYDASTGVSDTTFVYTGGDQQGSVKLAFADGTPATGGSMVIRNQDGVDVTNVAAPNTGVVNAGSYTVEYTNPDGDVYNYKFTVEKLDLAEAG